MPLTTIAALAALVTIFFAKRTDEEARKSLVELGKISKASNDAVKEQLATVKALSTAHREEMAERQRALDGEMAVQRIVQMERLSELAPAAKLGRSAYGGRATLLQIVGSGIDVLAQIEARARTDDTLGAKPEAR